MPSQNRPSSGQMTGASSWQPFSGSQTSFPLQKSPSSQTALSGAWSHLSFASLQESTVQSTPSLQSTGVPALQIPVPGGVGQDFEKAKLQTSFPLQKFPSSHSASDLQPSTGTSSQV